MDRHNELLNKIALTLQLRQPLLEDMKSQHNQAGAPDAEPEALREYLLLTMLAEEYWRQLELEETYTGVSAELMPANLLEPRNPLP